MKRFLSVLALALFLAGGSQVLGNDNKREISFGALEVMSAETAQTQAASWLQSIGKNDADTMARFDAIWKQPDLPVLDLVAHPWPWVMPVPHSCWRMPAIPTFPPLPKYRSILKDTKNSLFFRA